MSWWFGNLFSIAVLKKFINDQSTFYTCIRLPFIYCQRIVDIQQGCSR